MPDTAIGSVLTDGTGTSPITLQKFAKDVVADALLSGAAALVAVNIVSLDAAIAQPTVVAFAVGGALIRVLFRAGLRWATTP